jgi:type I restriction enzyme M protein
VNHQALSSFIWSVADLLRGDYKQSDYGKVILPFTVLRRLDCVLEPAKAKVLAEFAAKQKAGLNPDPFLLRASGQSFYNTSELDLRKLMGDQDHISQNLDAYVQGFSPAVRDIFERFSFSTHIEKLAKSGLLYLVTEKFVGIDLHPEAVDNHEMGLAFEELIRKFAELSNETAGEHFTPREVIRLMVNLLFVEDDDVLTRPGVVRTIYDPTAGTGGMLSVAGEHLSALNPQARLTMFGQELNDESYAICKADMLIKGQDVANIVAGNTLSEDGHAHAKFDYMLSNPPFGVEWKKVEKEVREEHDTQGFNGRFGPGLPGVSDGSLLFLLHLLSKMRPALDGGSRFGIVLNGSPLFTGGAGSGASEIRRYLLENDLVEAIIGLPTDMFYNTGIATYVWIVSNRKLPQRKGKLQLIDASSFWQKMRRSLGSKRKEMTEAHIADVTKLFGSFVEAQLVTALDADGVELAREIVITGAQPPPVATGGKLKFQPLSRIFPNEAFGYRSITVERPLRAQNGDVVLGTKGKQKGKPQADASLRDTENVPLPDDVDTYFTREVLPHVRDAWLDKEKIKIGYEIPFIRYFSTFEPPRPLSAIDSELAIVIARIKGMIEEQQAVISHAISRGLDSRTEMKDSGLAWLGQIPTNWSVLPLKRIAALQSGEGITSELIEEEGPYPVFGGNGLRGFTNNFTHDGGYVLIGRQGALCGNINYASGKFWASEHAVVVSPRVPVDIFWLGEMLRNMNLNQYSVSAAQPGLSVEAIENLRVPLPPIAEQRSIATHLKGALQRIDALAGEAEKAITILHERRSAVISSAVTGKIDVSELPDAAERAA